MKTETKKQKMIAIFVVDGMLEITPVLVPEAEWKNEHSCIGAKIGNQPIIVLKGGWNKFTTYGGFETIKEAKEFRDVLKNYEARKVRAMRRVIEILRLQQKSITHLIRAKYSHQIHESASYCPLEELLEVDRFFRNRFFSALSTLGLTYDDFQNKMIEYEKKEKEKTGRGNTTASWQLSWVMSIVKENMPGRQRLPHR